MTLWESDSDIQSFAKTGAHFVAMGESKRLASEIQTITIHAKKIPSWKEANRLLRSNASQGSQERT
jgi:hypothetical protein